jgi:hypothetical protein
VSRGRSPRQLGHVDPGDALRLLAEEVRAGHRDAAEVVLRRLLALRASVGDNLAQLVEQGGDLLGLAQPDVLALGEQLGGAHEVVSDLDRVVDGAGAILAALVGQEGRSPGRQDRQLRGHVAARA